MNQNINNQISNREENKTVNHNVMNNMMNEIENLKNNLNNLGSNNVVVASNTVEKVNNDLKNNVNIIHVARENYPVDKNSEVPLHERWNDVDTMAPPPVPNGGLFSGPQAMGEYSSIHVTPTATNMIHNNLRSANPPPGATEQYPGTNRLGNNYVAMPGVYWYADTHPVNKGPFEMKVTERK